MSKNTLNLKQKKAYMESEKIDDYLDSFGPESLFKGENVADIIFSLDGKYCFVCKVHLEDFINGCKNYSDSMPLFGVYDLIKRYSEFCSKEVYYKTADARKWFARYPEVIFIWPLVLMIFVMNFVMILMKIIMKIMIKILWMN